MKRNTRLLTADEARAVLDYNPETGEFRWKVSKGSTAQAGQLAGSPHAKGYLTIRVNYRLYLAHRLAWLIVTGDWPKSQIDHWDTDKSNNRFSNLRDASNGQNQANIPIRSNNTSGRKGVSWNKGKKKWEVRTRLENRQQFIGYFDDLDEASQAYQEALRENFGEFARAA